MEARLGPLIAYINEILGLRVLPQAWNKAADLPLFLKERYQFYHIELLSINCVIVADVDTGEQTPAAIEKHFIQLAAKTDGFFIYFCETISRYNRKRLIERKIPFVIPGNQMYLPFLGVDLHEYFHSIRRRSEKLSPAAQRLLLYLLQKKYIEGVNPVKMAELLGYTTMTMTRAFQELESVGIGRHKKVGKNKMLYLTEDKKTLWEKALPYLQSPVQKRLYVRRLDEADDFPYLFSLAGQSALANMSMIAEPNIPTYAIQGRMWAGHIRRQFEVLPHPEPDAIELELWSYPVRLPEKENIADGLSLFLSLMDNTDERVQGALSDIQKECLK